MSENRRWRNAGDGIVKLISNSTTSNWGARLPVEPSNIFLPDTEKDLQSLVNYWDFTADADGIEQAPNAAAASNYESVIVGLALLILCLLVIGIILVIAMYRVRRLRLIGTGMRPTSCRRSIRRHATDVEGAHFNEAYVTGAPPAYQMQMHKPICPDPPPSYEYLMQSSVVEEETPATSAVSTARDCEIESAAVVRTTDESHAEKETGQGQLPTISALVDGATNPARAQFQEVSL